MMKPLSPEHAEELRHAVLERLAGAPLSARTARALRRGLANEMDYAITEDDVTAALLLLQGLGYVKLERDPLGSTAFWQITSAGVLAFERDPRTAN